MLWEPRAEASNLALGYGQGLVRGLERKLYQDEGRRVSGEAGQGQEDGEGGTASCKSTRVRIVQFMQAIPRCWTREWGDFKVTQN